MEGFYTTVTADGMRWTISNDFRDSFPVTLAENAAEAEKNPNCTVLRNKSGRSTILINNAWKENRSILVKSFWIRTWLEYIKYLFVRTRAFSEWDANLAFGANGIKTVKPLAIGESRIFGFWQKSTLILEAIAPCSTLHEYLRDNTDRSKTAPLLDRLAAQVAAIHNCDIHYRDLHGENIIIESKTDGTPSFYFIDLHEVRQVSSISNEKCIDDLGRLNGYILTTAANRLHFLKQYLTARGIDQSQRKTWARKIDARSRSLWERFYRRRGTRIDAYGPHANRKNDYGKRSLIILDKVFLSPRMKTLRGVEVFNVNFMKDLAAAGFSMTVPIHRTWQEILQRELGSRVETVTAASGGALLGSIKLAFSLRKRKFSALLMTNVANRLIPMLRLFRLFRSAPYCVLIAHREPSRRSLHAQKCWPSRIVAVNEKIADHFRNAGFPSVTVYYGITEADRFYPPTRRIQKDTIDFCILGHLDSGWKGADTAIAAFSRIDGKTSSKCRLHMASYRNPPTLNDDRIILYDWMPFEQIADLLRQMDVMLVPSRDEEVMRETFSQAIVQGMLTELPCIVNNLPILTCKLDEGGGLIFNSIDELSRHMTYLAENPEKRHELGRQARKTALTRYVWNTSDFIETFLHPAPRH